jgi:hypothetical protein
MLELLLQARHVQARNIPAARLALTMENQRTQVSEHLTAALVSTQEWVERAVVHPLAHKFWVDAGSADLGVQIEIHV